VILHDKQAAVSSTLHGGGKRRSVIGHPLHFGWETGTPQSGFWLPLRCVGMGNVNAKAAPRSPDWETSDGALLTCDLMTRAQRRSVMPLPGTPRKQKRKDASIATIVVEKASRDVRAYDKEGKLLGYYPATIGSGEKPAPSGTFEVRRVAYNPDYHYNPKFAWKGVKAKEPLTIKPGPNNSVGLVWIDLTAPSYGIHGTPEPTRSVRPSRTAASA
jgi:lipoprotein-anchoring transpeptidase ErfK/SrfK